jgi:hypothetical protein
MDHIFGFLGGFITAGLIGKLSVEILSRWSAIDTEHSKQDSQILFGEIGRKVIALILLPLTLLTIVAGTFFVLQYDWLLAFIAGCVVSALIGFQLQRFTYLWAEVVTIINRTRFDIREKMVRGLSQPTEFPDSNNLHKNSERIDHLEKIISKKSRRLNKLKEKEAFYGKSADPSTIMEIEDIEKELQELQTELANLNNQVN